MSAIAGIFYFNGAPAEAGMVEKLTTAMGARGPDEQHHWHEDAVALGHCMLRTTPEAAAEHQPLVSHDGNLVLVWDGRLDNREELRRKLTLERATIRNISDAELALQSYVAWGEDCPAQLLGDFAFAVWDRARQQLFCARDHMGARPFYYTSNDRFFAFASEEEAFLELPGVRNVPNEELITYLLVPSLIDFDHNRSWLADVWILPAATSIRIARNGESIATTYWQLTAGAESQYTSDRECEEAFMAVFGNAVRCRMRSAGSIATMMSGGLDSASVGTMAKQLLPQMPGKEFHTYSAISDDPESCIETRSIFSLTQDLGDNAHYISVPSLSGGITAQDLIDTAWSKAHPVDNSLFLPWMMFLAAHRNNHRVMLHGASGDLTTYVPGLYIAHLLKTGFVQQAWRACRAASRNNVYLRGHSPASLLLRNSFHAFSPPPIKRLLRQLRSTYQPSALAKSLINPQFAEKYNLAERLDTSARDWDKPIEEMQHRHIKVLTSPHGIASGLTIFDKVAGQYGVEPRDPWSDKRVVEFFLRLPSQRKIPNGWTKHLVRATIAENLAPEVRWRLDKQHVGWNFAWRLASETKSFVYATLNNNLDVVEPYLNRDKVRQHFSRSDLSSATSLAEAYDIVTLILWLNRLHTKGRRPNQ